MTDIEACNFYVLNDAILIHFCIANSLPKLDIRNVEDDIKTFLEPSKLNYLLGQITYWDKNYLLGQITYWSKLLIGTNYLLGQIVGTIVDTVTEVSDWQKYIESWKSEVSFSTTTEYLRRYIEVDVIEISFVKCSHELISCNFFYSCHVCTVLSKNHEIRFSLRIEQDW